MLNKILEENKNICDNLKYVTINYKAIEKFVEEENNYYSSHYLTNNPYGIMDLDIDQIINFLLMYDSINYSFWADKKFEIEVDNEKIDGSYALLYLLLNKFKEDCFDKINGLSEEQLKEMFKSENEMPLLEERIKTLKSMSNIVINKFNGNFYEAIKNINNDIELFDFIINNFENFIDERTYNGKKIGYYKLAQLLVSDILMIRKYKENIDVDYSHILGCADYKIPQVMRNLGILEYNSELSNIVDNKVEILENSIYEIEIRSCTLIVINYIYELLDKKVDRIDINNYIWNKGQVKSIKDLPYHRTRTVNY